MRHSVPLSLLLLLSACGGGAFEDEQEEGALDPAREEQKSELDACGYAEPCSAARFTYGLEPSGVRECMIDALASGTPVHFSIASVADGGGDCSATHEIYVGSDGSVIVWWRGDSDCSQDPADTFYRYELEQCTLAERSFFENCQSAEPMPPYDSCDWGTWYSSCVPLDAPSCS